MFIYAYLYVLLPAGIYIPYKLLLSYFYHTIILYYTIQDVETPLHCASQYGHLKVALLLLDRGADPNAKAKVSTCYTYGTPLHLASVYGHLDVSLLLLNRGADPNAKNVHGRTPGQVAGTNYQASLDNAKAIGIFLERWSVLMTILMLRELSVFHLGNIDLAMMDLFEFIGDEKDFVQY